MSDVDAGEPGNDAALAFLAGERAKLQEVFDRVLPVEAALAAIVGPEPGVVEPRVVEPRRPSRGS